MRFATVFLLVAMVGFCGNSIAQTIFNIQQPQTQNVQQGGQQPQIQSAQTVRHEPTPRTTSSASVEKKLAAQQYDRRSNESIDDYQIRMNAMSQRSLADLERASREHNEKMKALAPK